MPDGYNERASPKQLIAQGQLSARPSPRLHPSASMPNIWQGESTSPLSARTPSRLRLIPDDAHNGQMVSPLGLTIPTGTRTSDARAPGQPLTPPLSPNAPTTRQSPQQNMVGVTRISPFRASPPQFDPFSSYNFNMLPSPARSAHRTQQPIAEDAQEGIFSSPGQVQFPRTEQQPALVADTEQDDSSNGSPTLVSPTSLVSPSTHRTRLESPINILDYDAGIQRSGRLLFVNHVPRDATNEELTNNFSVLGALKGLYRRYLATDGVVILAFFDMRDAAAAHRYHLRTRRFFKENVSLESTFISPTQLAKQLGNSCFVDVCEGEVYISTMGEGTLNQTALQNALASYGGLRQFRVVGSHGKAFFAEFFDTRDADHAVKELHDRQLLGVHLRLTHRQPPAILNLPPITYDSIITIADLQRQQDEIALFQHYREIVESKQREELEAAVVPMRSPDSGDIARGGPFDATGGSLGRRGSFPGSSPRIDEREERFASLTDGSMLLSSPLDRHTEFERERKSSNIYGPDHSKAPILSYPSPRTPTRTETSKANEVGIPKGKISLPPYSGPLPLPDSHSDMAWPLPVLRRLPTPPLSASTKMFGGSPPSDADSPEFFIPTQTPPRRQGRAVYGTVGAQAAHQFLPAAVRSVVEVIREPPPERNKIDLNRIREGHDTRTTVMLKNVPNKMTDRHLMAFIDSVTPKSYSFLYLRMDFENHCNVGYAFVNFIDVASLLRFAETKLGQKWGMFNSEKVLHMSYANYQGKEALVEKFRNSGVMEEREAWRPKIFYSSGPRKGDPEPFPAPNNHLRQQRSFQNGRAQGLYSANAPHALNYGLSPI